MLPAHIACVVFAAVRVDDGGARRLAGASGADVSDWSDEFRLGVEWGLIDFRVSWMRCQEQFVVFSLSDGLCPVGTAMADGQSGRVDFQPDLRRDADAGCIASESIGKVDCGMDTA